jgi:hypothetical protein
MNMQCDKKEAGFCSILYAKWATGSPSKDTHLNADAIPSMQELVPLMLYHVFVGRYFPCAPS